MSKFITGKALEDAVYDIIFKAESVLLIVSPFIKLDNYFKTLFDNHVQNPHLHLVIVFGKNEFNVSKSFGKEDFEYFKKFHKVTIIYVPTLHGKFYANEKTGVITSINLLDYSFKNNIEFGVTSDFSVLNSLTGSSEQAAWEYCRELAENNDVVFCKRPQYEKRLLGLSKNFIGSEVLFDATEDLLDGQDFPKKRKSAFLEEIEIIKNSAKVRPTREDVEKRGLRKQENSTTIHATNESQPTHEGQCIRCSKFIPYNMIKPLCLSCYKVWATFKNPEYLENFCHACGKPTENITMNKPYCDDCLN
jgi:hypothetical protein